MRFLLPLLLIACGSSLPSHYQAPASPTALEALAEALIQRGYPIAAQDASHLSTDWKVYSETFAQLRKRYTATLSKDHHLHLTVYREVHHSLQGTWSVAVIGQDDQQEIHTLFAQAGLPPPATPTR